MAFVGRAEEMHVLTSAYERMVAGEGSVVFLDGEAGVGKTRLLDEFVSRLEAEAADVDVLYGAYHPGGYGPGADALSQAVVGRFGAAALEQDRQAEGSAREFLISVADGTSGLDLERLRSVRDRAWR